MMRIENLRKIMKHNGVDSVLITSPYNKFYLANFSSGSGYLFITSNDLYAIVDSRYFAQVQQSAEGFKVLEFSSNRKVEDLINRIIYDEDIAVVGFEGEHLTYDAYNSLSKKLDAKLRSISLETLRAIKSQYEIKQIKRAAEIADEAYSHILSYIKAGMTEKQVENELVRYIKELGGSRESFETIVVSGIRGALPHGKASDKVIEEGDFITLDFGVNNKGYCSDITRTFALGMVEDEELLKIYELVRRAQQEAVSSSRPGITTSELDSIARSIIEGAGYGRYFRHNLGHGLGILVHEFPTVGKGTDTILEAGMIITIEPGIYIEGLGGVRIEDDVLITENGHEFLTNSDRELIVVKG